MHFHDIDQNTGEWLDLRVGKLTGSNAGKVMANAGKAFSDAAKDLALKVALEQITGARSINESFSNAHTERGHDQEPVAISRYEEHTFQNVLRGGFFDCGFTGCSPDGRVGDNGLIEVKSVISSVHRANIKRGGLDPAYKWQKLFNLRETGREWLDFVSYCADYPDDKKLFIYRLYAKNRTSGFNMLGERIEEFRELVEETKKEILQDAQI